MRTKSKKKKQKLNCLDVRRCVVHYFQCTKEWRKSPNVSPQFSWRNKKMKASSDLISWWIRQVICLASSPSEIFPSANLRGHILSWGKLTLNRSVKQLALFPRLSSNAIDLASLLWLAHPLGTGFSKLLSHPDLFSGLSLVGLSWEREKMMITTHG